MHTAELVQLIREAGRKPVERGTLYNVIREYDDTPNSLETAAL
jgi:2-iminoacetate synthase ThiH